MSSETNRDANKASKPIKIDESMTKRKPLLKLELSGDPFRQLDLVARTLYDVNMHGKEQSADNIHWKTIDEELYAKAKKSYDEIVSAFLEDPKVYKFTSTKERIWRENMRQQQKMDHDTDASVVSELSDRESTSRSKSRGASRRRKRKNSEQTLQQYPTRTLDPTETFIDPFQHSNDWRQVTNGDGSVAYQHTKTGEVSMVKPQIWSEKLHYLEKLSPRDDFDGYEYRESAEERDFRFSKQLEYQERLFAEINRRECEPTDIEQVEDALFYIVDTVCTREEHHIQQLKQQRKQQMRESWNIATRQYRMKHLGLNTTEDGQVNPVVSDFEFCNFLISSTGHMAALTIPPEMLALHEQEREIARELQRKQSELQEYEKRRPFVEKLRFALLYAHNDPRQMARNVINQIKLKLFSIPKHLTTLAHDQIVDPSKALAQASLNSVLDALHDPEYTVETISNSVLALYQHFTPKQQQSEQRTIEDFNRVLDQEEQHRRKIEQILLQQETVQQRQQRLHPEPVSVVLPNCVQIKLTVLLDPPPMYCYRPEQLWTDNAMAKTFTTVDKVRKNLKYLRNEFATRFQRWIPPAYEHQQQPNHNHATNLIPNTPREAVVGACGVLATVTESAQENEVENEAMVDEQQRTIDDNNSHEIGNVNRASNSNEESSRVQLHDPDTVDDSRREDGQPHSHLLESTASTDDNSSSNHADSNSNNSSSRSSSSSNGGCDSSASNEKTSEEQSATATVDDTLTLNTQPDPVSPQHRSLVPLLNLNAATVPTSLSDNHVVDVANASAPIQPPMQFPAEEETTELRMPAMIMVQGQHVPKLQARKIMASKTFLGRITPDDLVLPNVLVTDPTVKMVYDDSDRKLFESSFVNELAEACGIPNNNVQIQAIHRLPINDDRLQALKRKKTVLLNETLQQKQMHEHRIALERMRRKASMDGTIAKYYNEQLEQRIERHRQSLALSTLSIPSSAEDDQISERSSTVMEDIKTEISDACNHQNTAPFSIRSTDELPLQVQFDTVFMFVPLRQKRMSITFAGDVTPMETLALKSIFSSNDPVAETQHQHQPQNVLIPDQEPQSELDSKIIVKLSKEEGDDKCAPLSQHTGTAAAFESSDDIPFVIQQTIEYMISHIEKAVRTNDDIKNDTAILPLDANDISISHGSPVVLVSDTEIASFSRHSDHGDISVQNSQMTVQSPANVKLKERLDLKDFENSDYNQPANVDAAAMRAIVITQAEPPKYFKIGIPNPDERKFDKMYWQANQLRDISAAEKRAFRIRKLKAMRKKSTLEQQLKHVQLIKDDLIEDTLDLLNPVIEKLESYVKTMQPYLQTMNQKLLVASSIALQKFLEASKLSSSFSLLYIRRLNVSLQQVLLKMKKQSTDTSSLTNRMHTITNDNDSDRNKDYELGNRIDLNVSNLLHELLEIVEMSSHDTIHKKVRLNSSFTIPEITTTTLQLHLIEELSVESATESKIATNHTALRYTSTDEDNDVLLDNPVVFLDTAAAAATASLSPLEESSEILNKTAECKTIIDDEATENLDADGKENDEENDAEEEEESEEEIEDREVDEETDSEKADDANDNQNIAKEDSILAKELGEALDIVNERTDIIVALNNEAQQLRKELHSTQKEVSELQNIDAMQESLYKLRQIRTQLYPLELVNLMDDMCYAVELNAEDPGDSLNSQDVGDDMTMPEAVPLDEHGTLAMQSTTKHANIRSALPEEYFDDKLVGCEITVMIHVDEVLRQMDGLREIEAEDIAVLLEQYMSDLDSPLHSSGQYLREILDVQYQLPYKQKEFKTWESFWVHIIHPTFFGYSVRKRVKPISERSDDNRLESGIVPSDPTEKFTQQNSETYTYLDKRYKAFKALEKREKRRNRDQTSLSTATSEQGNGLLNLPTDEFDGSKKIRVFRPNMETLTEKDLMRLKRTYKALNEEYETEMRKGLVDGVRLRPEQFAAMKERDTAFRIYITARQKFGRQNKHLNEDVVLPKLQVTKINDKVFQGWMDEAVEEDQHRLREIREKAMKMKSVLKQEAETRRNYAIKKSWIIKKFLHITENSDEVMLAFQQEMQEMDALDFKLRNNSMPNETAAKELVDKKSTLQMAIISEEKRTRKLFHILEQWIERSVNPDLPQRRLPTFSADFDVQEESLRDGEIKEVDREASVRTATPSTDELIQQELKPKRSMPVLEPLASQSSPLKPDQFEPSMTINNSASAMSSSHKNSEKLPERSNEKLKSSLSNATLFDEENTEEHQPKTIERQQLFQYLHSFYMHQTKDNRRKQAESKLPRTESPMLALRQQLDSKTLSRQNSPARIASLSKDRTFSEDLDSPLLQLSEDAPLSPFRTAETEDMPAPAATLTTEEYELAKSLRWIRALLRHKELVTCLKEYPTQQPNAMTKDELAQFATILVEVQPVIAAVQKKLADAKSEANKAMGVKNEPKKDEKEVKAERKVLRDELRKSLDEEEKQRQFLDAQDKLEKVRKQAEREKAWFMAHTHKFIKQAGKPPFCIVCKERRHDYWMKVQRDEEKLIRRNVEEKITEKLGKIESDVRAEVEQDLRGSFETQAEIEVARMIKEEEDAKRAAERLSSKGRVRKVSIFSTSSGSAKLSNKQFSRSEKSSKTMFNTASANNSRRNSMSTDVMTHTEDPYQDNNDEVDEAEIAWQAELDKMRNLIDNAGLSRLNARGNSILPTEPSEEFKNREKLFVPPLVIFQNDLEYPPKTPNLLTRATSEMTTENIGAGAKISSVSMGLAIRVWNRDEKGRRSHFLGMIEIPEEVLLNPPLGNRTYKLSSDVNVVDKNPVQISGSLSIRVNTMKKGKKRSDGSNECWKIEVVKGIRLAAVDQSKLSNPYCEVYWRGMAERDDEVIQVKNWISVGETRKKESTINPIYDKEKDKNVFELPPVWTTTDIPNRGIEEDEWICGGGWVARNQLPRDDDDDDLESHLQSKHTYGTKPPEEIRKFRTAVRVNELVITETKQRLEMARWRMRAQEMDRKYMAEEEKLTRMHLMTSELVECKPLIMEQTEYARQFNKILHLVQSPSNILTRLRFMMAELLAGGGMRVMCEDPSYGQMLQVVTIPLIHQQDEDSLKQQLNVLIGKPSDNLAKIVDYGVHQLRDYNNVGFVSTDERCALAVLEYYAGMTISDYLKEHWEDVPDEVFRDIVCQVCNGLLHLHEEGLIHRNIHYDCVVLIPPKKDEPFDSTQLINSKSENNITTTTSAAGASQHTGNEIKGKRKPAKALVNKINCRLGDYWFLHNPRRESCDQSLGRADYGSIATAPPEAYAAAKSTSLYNSGGNNVSQRRNTKNVESSFNMTSSSAITQKSDIYAFGACVYYWATGGQILPTGAMKGVFGGAGAKNGMLDMDMLRKKLPQRWGSWLLALLKMCLSANPELRASAKDLQLFLMASRHATKKKN